MRLHAKPLVGKDFERACKKLERIIGDEPLSLNDIANLLDISRGQAWKVVKALKKKGVIKYIRCKGYVRVSNGG
ncbi:MAG: hypothetical protein DRO14_00230 [Thermoprotei archaeon]|nr:MAG: hypothetical protein DRO14_00205 [Thermoprotei archaeon]RLG78575.1 MAG: hypothetical protein DRO14_00230 [Thermoprotei archaeon]